jgi:aminoglycoside phosphotransferase (APT) family kinase protein
VSWRKGSGSVPGHALTDPGISTLPEILDPAALAMHLRQALPDDRGPIQDIQLQLIKHHPGQRCTFEIAVRTLTGWDCLIGKVYADDRSDVYRAMEEISRAGFGPEAEFAIPRPVAYLAPLRLLLYEKVPGTRAKALILNPHRSDRVLAATRCAGWLARFHALGPRSGRVVGLDDQLTFLERCWRSLADLGRPFADKASRLFDRLSATAGLGAVEMCAGHGRYSCGQVLLVEGRTVTVDWDTYRVADPSCDVARALVDLKRLGLKHFASICALDAVAHVFLKAYGAAGRIVVATHLAFHKAAICLERAKRDLDKDAREWAKAMLDEGLRILKLILFYLATDCSDWVVSLLT